MSAAACVRAIGWERAVAYLAGELPADDEADLELHLLGCAACTETVARAGAVVEALRALVPPVVSRATLARLQARGVRVREQGFAPGARGQVVFTPDVDLLIHRLEGLALADARRVDVTVVHDGSGRVLVEVADVPFDPAAGQVLIACHRHYASMPPDIAFEVTAHTPDGTTRAGRVTVDHVFG